MFKVEASRFGACLKPVVLISGSNWNLEMLIFVEEGKPESTEKNPHSAARTNKKLNRHVTLRPRTEPGAQRWETKIYIA